MNLALSSCTIREEMSAFADAMENKVFEAVGELNTSQTTQVEHFEYDVTEFVVRVVRGDVVEKCGFMRTVVKKELPPLMPEPLVNRYMQIDIYPKTPLVGMLHIAMNFSYYRDGSDMVGGIMDITPGTVIEEDLAFVENSLNAVFAGR